MNAGLHASYADCTVVAIEFRPGEPVMVRMLDKRGGELLVVASLAFVGSTLEEIQRLGVSAVQARVHRELTKPEANSGERLRRIHLRRVK